MVVESKDNVANRVATFPTDCQKLQSYVVKVGPMSAHFDRSILLFGLAHGLGLFYFISFYFFLCLLVFSFHSFL